MILKSWGRRSRSRHEERPEEGSASPPGFRPRPSEAEVPDDLGSYLRHLILSLEEVPLVGLVQGDRPFRGGFESLYVPPTLTILREERAEVPGDREGEPGPEEGEEGEERDRHIGIGEALSRHRRLVVIGGPGSGKSALLRYLCLTIARRLARQRLGLEEGFLPIPVAGYRRESDLPVECTPRALCLLAGWEGDPEAGETLFSRYLDQGRVFFLVDSPEKGRREGGRQGLLSRVRTWTAAYPGVRCVLTAEPEALEAVCSPSDFALAALDPSGPPAVEGIARKWFLAAAPAVYPYSEPERLTERMVAGLTAAVRRSGGADRLAVKPGDLIRMGLVYLHRSDLPGSKLDLLRDYVDVVISCAAWQDDLTPSERLMPAQRAAVASLDGGDGPDFVSAVQEGLQGVDSLTSPTGDAWIQAMASVGLVAPEVGGGWGFPDRLCRDYLAAREVCAKAGEIDRLMDLLRHPDRRHLLVWCAGILPDPTPVVRAVLAQEESMFREGLQTASRCLAHGRGASEAIRREVCSALFELSGGEGFSLLREWVLDRLSEMGAEEVVPEFLVKLRDGSAAEREMACEAVGRIGGPTCVAALSERAGHDPASGVRVSACRALGRIGSEAAAELLGRLALESEDAQVRGAACRALGRIGSDTVLARMTEAMKDRRASVRSGAAFALGRIGDPRAVPILLVAMVDEYSSVRWRAIQALGLIRAGEALDPLMEAMSDEDWAVRRAACEALGRIGSGSALKPLVEALRDSYSSVRRAACEALGKIGAESAVPFLVRTLKDEDWAVRRAACDALCHVRSDAAVEPLLRSLRDRDAFVRAAGAEILGWIDKGRAADLLAHALRSDEYSSVRRAACEALARMSGDRYTEAIRGALKDTTSTVRKAALRGLCLRAPSDLPDILAGALTDLDEDVRQEACEALGIAGPGVGEKVLVQALEDEVPGVRQKACEALGRIGEAACITPLVGLLRDPEVGVRDAAFEALWLVCQRTGSTVLLKDLNLARQTGEPLPSSR